LVQAGGFLIINSSLVNRAAQRKDVQAISIPGTEEAEKLGDKRLANMVLLGGLVQNAGLVPLAAVEVALKESSSEKQKNLLELNIRALKKGAEYNSK